MRTTLHHRPPSRAGRSSGRVPGEPTAADAGLDPHIGGLVAYVLFGWVGGLIMLLTQDHREVRFHGAQSVLLSAGVFAVHLGLTVLSWGVSAVLDPSDPRAVWTLVQAPFGLVVLVLWVVMCVQGYRLVHVRLPVVGAIAERWAA